MTARNRKERNTSDEIQYQKNNVRDVVSDAGLSDR